MKRSWRQAATLIVVARDVSKNLKFDYKVLTFKRTEKTSFMPNSICFAGGAIDKTDEMRDWLEFLRKNKIELEELRRKPRTQKPFIFDQPEDLLDRETSLRITAIRETFEELGVIFCRDPNEPQTSPFSTFFHTKNCDVPVWQKKIHDHEESLRSFCEQYNVVPDLMNVHEWSCWLTPTYFRPRRFETAFFLVALNSMPPVYPETHEVQEFQWNTPDELLQLHKEKKLWLPPPQLTEMLRLSTIKSIDQLVEIAKSRNGESMLQLMPVQFKTTEGFLHLLPGDDLYPKNPNYHEPDHDLDQFGDKTFEEMRSKAKNLCRYEQYDMFHANFVCNIKPSDGHVPLESASIVLWSKM